MVIHRKPNQSFLWPSNSQKGRVAVETTIAELVSTVAEVTGFSGAIEYDSSKPDGAPRKLMDNSKLKNLGWSPQIDLRTGLENAYRWFVDNIDVARM